jgi:hypothetical protein
MMTVAPKRMQRLILPPPIWQEDARRSERVYLARTPNEWIMLEEHGVTNAAYIGPWTDEILPPARFRSVLGRADTLCVAVWEKDRLPQARIIENLLERMSACLDRLKVCRVPVGTTLSELVRTQGAARIYSMMEASVPVSRLLLGDQ